LLSHGSHSIFIIETIFAFRLEWRGMMQKRGSITWDVAEPWLTQYFYYCKIFFLKAGMTRDDAETWLNNLRYYWVMAHIVFSLRQFLLIGWSGSGWCRNVAHTASSGAALKHIKMLSLLQSKQILLKSSIYRTFRIYHSFLFPNINFYKHFNKP
jgi:hypothetical protein